MKLAMRIVGVLLGLFVAFELFVLVVSEIGEVVLLQSTDSDGEVHTTRLWIVEDAGATWLRCGGADRGWCQRLDASPDAELERDGSIRPLRAVAVRDPATTARIHERVLEKYGFAERLIRSIEDLSGAYPIRLEPR